MISIYIYGQVSPISFIYLASNPVGLVDPIIAFLLELFEFISRDMTRMFPGVYRPWFINYNH